MRVGGKKWLDWQRYAQKAKPDSYIEKEAEGHKKNGRQGPAKWPTLASLESSKSDLSPQSQEKL